MTKVNVISDSTYTVQGHGVHTAFESQVEGLRGSGIEVDVNGFGRDYDITHIHTFGLLGLYHAVFGSGKKVISAHVILASLTGSVKGERWWLPLMRRYMKFYFKRADLLLAVSPMVAESLINEFGMDSPVEVLFNGINKADFFVKPGQKEAIRAKLGIPSEAFVVIGNGQVQPRKRFDIFCDVARHMDQVKFMWVGGSLFGRLSDEYGKLQKVIAEAPSNVDLVGIIPHEHVHNYLAAADVFWLPSVQENHPMAVLEAAGAGLPILLRDIREYDVSFGSNVLRGNDETFADIIEKLRTDAGLYKQAHQGAKHIAERFDNQQIISELMEHYSVLLGELGYEDVPDSSV